MIKEILYMCNSKSIKEYHARIKNITAKKSDITLEIDHDNVSPILYKYITQLQSYNDVLTIQDFREITDMGEHAVFRRIKNKKLKTILYHSQIHLIPKVWVYDYIISKNFSDFLENQEKNGRNKNDIK